MYKFCPSCGEKISQKSHNLYVCPSCGFRFYQNPAPTTGAFIIDEKKRVLLVKRKHDPYKDYWDVPGGFVEPGETAEQSLKRELKEELEFTPKNFAYLSSYVSIYPYQKITYKTLCLMYVIKTKRFTPKIGDDVSGYEWFPMSSIPFERLAFSFIEKALKDYFR